MNYSSKFRSAAKCSGERSYYLKREAALLEIALVQYAMTKAVEKVMYFMILIA